VLAPVFVWRAVKEERLLQAEYPGEYGPYKARTKALIPFVW
jgi:protein-S-isoprenylcysteine O-methyltransferase Ste14